MKICAACVGSPSSFPIYRPSWAIVGHWHYDREYVSIHDEEERLARLWPWQSSGRAVSLIIRSPTAGVVGTSATNATCVSQMSLIASGSGGPWRGGAWDCPLGNSITQSAEPGLWPPAFPQCAHKSYATLGNYSVPVCSPFRSDRTEAFSVLRHDQQCPLAVSLQMSGTVSTNCLLTHSASCAWSPSCSTDVRRGIHR